MEDLSIAQEMLKAGIKFQTTYLHDLYDTCAFQTT
jgi:hypothetical protein